MCEEWLNDYTKFRDWSIENGYNDSLSIDRIDNSKDYCPQNCRWATTKQQANNKTVNINLTFKGETHTAAEWSKILGIKSSTIRKRLKMGWNSEDALSVPVEDIKHYITINGETHSMGEWDTIKGYSEGFISGRILHGWDEVDAVLTPPLSKRKHKIKTNKRKVMN